MPKASRATRTREWRLHRACRDSRSPRGTRISPAPASPAVLVRACDGSGAPFEGIEPLPRNKTPIAAWTDFDAAWTEVVRSLRETTLAAAAGERPSGAT